MAQSQYYLFCANINRTGGKFYEIKALAEYTSDEITKSPEEWKKFLHTAGNMYKYPFDEQMLIYAQRPDATACASLGSDPSGNITRINNALEGMSKQLEEAVTKLQNVEHQLETAKIEVTKPFPQEAELSQKLDRLAELNALLNMDEKGDEAMDVDDEYNLPKDTEEKCEQSSGFDNLGKRPSMRARLSEKIEIVAEQNSRPKDREVEAQRSYRSRNAPYISLVG